MREIKFRVRDLKENKWVSPNILIDYSGLLFWSFGGEVELIDDRDRYDVQFYTGLQDKNRVEIYEGDIVQFGNGRGRVYYNEKICAYGVIGYWESWERARVIGNIYDNPGLVKK